MTGRDAHPGAFALACAARGWHVFPLTVGDKPPLAGFTDWEANATTDPARIRACWSRAQYNVGIACGPSGLVVIDLDVPKPGEHPPAEWDMPGVNDGADAFAVLCERQGEAFPFETFTVRTRRGGWHLYFQAPTDVRLTNTAGKSPRALGWKIDTRAHGGYVVGPGSYVDLPDGVGSYEVVHSVAPMPLPEWLTDLLKSAPVPAPALSACLRSAEVGDLDAYAQAALKAEADRVASAERGGRNRALNKAAYNLGRIVAAGVLPEDIATGALYDAASVHFGPSRDDVRPSEAQATIRCAIEAGKRNPRDITRRGAA
ncbi:bifunctional DNA primase/polymerase [Actinomadura geliboluensis]|uniref:bifunctional DNA primase/polymerase n=1 Tax=Actinomadura geliboluensis TaxID=882440 RepID=UPI003710B5D9